MNRYQEEYNRKKMSARQVLENIQSRDFVFTPMAASCPDALMGELQHLKDTGVKDVILQICIPSVDYPVFHDPEMKAVMAHHGWFFTAGLRKANAQRLVSAVPQHSTSILRKTLDRIRYEGRRPVLLTTVSPMDARGYMSLSISSIYEMDVVRAGAVLLVEVNPNYPRTFGDTMVHISQVTALVESDRPILCVDPAPYTEVDATIGKYVASLVEDGSTIQLGIGNIPNAVANELKSKKHLGIHTEMLCDCYLDMYRAGKITNKRKDIDRYKSGFGFAIGSEDLYDWVRENPGVVTYPISYCNAPSTVRNIENFVSINNCISVDLYGQICAESAGTRQISGTGGQLDFLEGAAVSPGGKAFICLTSTFTDKQGEMVSRITPLLNPGDIVTDPRSLAYYIVTEYGGVNLVGCSTWERAERLISVAHPKFRDELVEHARQQGIWIRSNKR